MLISMVSPLYDDSVADPTRVWDFPSPDRPANDRATETSDNVIQGNIGKEANADMPILATLRHAASEARRPRGEQRIRDELAKGTGIQKTAGIVGVGCGTVQRIKRAMAA